MRALRALRTIRETESETESGAHRGDAAGLDGWDGLGRASSSAPNARDVDDRVPIIMAHVIRVGEAVSVDGLELSEQTLELALSGLLNP